ncbi:hypothetical protein PCANC_10824 [Puccinia coronata f. sp. avenae]|uniref:Yeast cell wall synthesis Kre9/Knh1-like N-terminal domain-containing protein n=1 Tax=Puccinia coronata f. sp. avenae TaxID=200324 RepID=A0A2N5V0T6_9BASI|nr:hypothetical protein PCANC_10824 [Puccinia coronata f. sp. avenae]
MTSFTNSLIALAILNTAQGALFPTFPTQSDTCAVLRDCQIKWIDNSNLPSTTTMGETTIDLVMGNSSNLQAVQNLGGVANPSVATAITFQPIAGLSPTEKFAVRFIAKANASHPIFSTYFTITGGSGIAKPLVTPNSALAATVSSTASPSAIIGSKAPTGSTNASANIISTAKNDTVSSNAQNSSAGSVHPSFAAVVGIFALVSSAWFL